MVPPPLLFNVANRSVSRRTEAEAPPPAVCSAARLLPTPRLRWVATISHQHVACKKSISPSNSKKGRPHLPLRRVRWQIPCASLPYMAFLVLLRQPPSVLPPRRSHVLIPFPPSCIVAVVEAQGRQLLHPGKRRKKSGESDQNFQVRGHEKMMVSAPDLFLQRAVLCL